VVFGFGTVDATVSADGKSATFTDWDGDLVTIKTNRGTLDASTLKLSSPNALTGGSHLVFADFTDAAFSGAKIKITARRGPDGGDGLVNLGGIDARGVALGKVSIDGDLTQIDAASLKALTVFSLGELAPADLHGGPLQSDILGTLGKLTVKTDVERVTFAAADFGTVQIGAALHDANFLAGSSLASLTVGASVSDTRILAGYSAAGLPLAVAAEIGKVTVGGNWISSDLVAGVTSGNGFFGDADDTLNGPGLLSRIAKITIAGAALGTVDDVRDHFGFVAHEIAAFKVGKAKLALSATGGPEVFEIGPTGDVTLREVG
jgi:hypothetical protein